MATMLSDEFLKGFRSAVSAYAMNTPRGGAHDAKPRFTPRTRASDEEELRNKADDNRRFTPRTRARHFTPRTRASGQFEEETNKSDDDRSLPMELMEIIRSQLDPDAYQMLKDALNGNASDQDPDEEEDKPANGLSPDLIDRICQFVGPHLSDDAFEEFQQLLDGMSAKPADDEPSPFSGRPTAGGGQDPVTSASRARSSARSPAEDAKRILSPTPGQLFYDNGTPFTGERNGYRYYQGVRLDSRPREVSASEQQSYASRFPNAARIKVL
jgi:hypothetical protein